MAARSIEERVAVIEATLSDIEREVDRTRERVHDLQTAVSTLNLLAQRISSVEGQVIGLRRDLGGLRRVLMGFAFTVASGVAVFAFTIFAAFK